MAKHISFTWYCPQSSSSRIVKWVAVQSSNPLEVEDEFEPRTLSVGPNSLSEMFLNVFSKPHERPRAGAACRGRGVVDAHHVVVGGHRGRRLEAITRNKKLRTEQELSETNLSIFFHILVRKSFMRRSQGG